jgi:hypothetical protein
MNYVKFKFITNIDVCVGRHLVWCKFREVSDQFVADIFKLADFPPNSVDFWKNSQHKYLK